MLIISAKPINYNLLLHFATFFYIKVHIILESGKFKVKKGKQLCNLLKLLMPIFSESPVPTE